MCVLINVGALWAFLDPKKMFVFTTERSATATAFHETTRFWIEDYPMIELDKGMQKWTEKSHPNQNGRLPLRFRACSQETFF